MFLEILQPREQRVVLFQKVIPQHKAGPGKAAVNRLEFGVTQPALRHRVARVERDADRHGLAVADGKIRHDFETVRGPVPEIKRPRAAEFKRVAVRPDVIQVQLGAADHQVLHRAFIPVSQRG